MLAPRFTASHFVVSWECPVDGPEARKRARRFAKAVRLMANGAMIGPVKPANGAAMISGYSRSQEKIDELRGLLPPDSQMRVLPVTEAQAQRQQNFWGRTRKIGEAV